VPILVSHYSRATLRNCILEWELEGFGLKGRIKDISVEEIGPTPVGTVRFKAPETPVPRRGLLLMRLQRKGGSLIARSFQDFGFFPRKPSVPPFAVALHGPEEDIAGMQDRLHRMGYRVKTGFTPDIPVAVATCLDADIVEYLREGGKALLLLERAEDIREESAPFQLVGREKDGRWGDWCSHLSWVRSEPPFARVMFVPALDFGFHKILPESVLEGFGPEHHQDILSGIFVGWLHSPAVLAVRFRVGKGTALATTLRLQAGIGEDPLAEELLHDMVGCFFDKGFRPQTILPL